jgi:hypothetical protein
MAIIKDRSAVIDLPVNSMDALSADTISKIPQFSKIIGTYTSWHKDGEKLVLWVNKKGNFKVCVNDSGSWDVYFGLEFQITRIKKDLKTLQQLIDLYYLLLGEELTIEVPVNSR